MSIGAINSTNSSQYLSQIFNQMQTELPQTSQNLSGASSSSSPVDTVEFSQAALKTNPLDSLVKSGTITQAQETQIDSALQAWRSNSGTTSTASTTAATSGSSAVSGTSAASSTTTNQGPLAGLIASGAITQDQATAVAKTLQASHHGHHKHGGGGASTSTSNSFIDSILNNLVSSNTISQTQENSIESALGITQSSAVSSTAPVSSTTTAAATTSSTPTTPTASTTSTSSTANILNQLNALQSEITQASSAIYSGLSPSAMGALGSLSSTGSIGQQMNFSPSMESLQQAYRI